MIQLSEKDYQIAIEALQSFQENGRILEEESQNRADKALKDINCSILNALDKHDIQIALYHLRASKITAEEFDKIVQDFVSTIQWDGRTEANIIEVLSGDERECVNCEHFRSFANIYFDDQEPDDIGWCVNERNKDFDAHIGYEASCDLFEP